jgi:hypothetical protein
MRANPRLTTLAATGVALTLGACASNDQRGEDIGWDSRSPSPSQGVTCLPPTCAFPEQQQPGRRVATAKSTIKPRR